jgi:hypothetical protein
MSELGQKRRFWPFQPMSALHPVATAKQTSLIVGEVPQADIATVIR